MISTLSPVEKAVAAVNATGLLQEEWYRNENPDVAKAGMAPAEHYVRYGEQENRRPNPYFDPAWYKKRAKGARKFDGPALVHFAQIGWKNGRSPSSFFSTALYLQEYPDVAASGQNSLYYHLTKGRFEGKAAFPTMLENDEIDGMPSTDMIEDMRTLVESGLFDATWYRNHYSDLRHIKADMLFHFARHGANEARQPNMIFQTEWYRAEHRKLIADQNPVIFYIEQGANLGHDPAPNFSCARYFADNASLSISPGKDEALSHYLNSGILLGCTWPHPTKKHNSRAKARKASALPIASDLRTLVDYTRVPLAPESTNFNSRALNIHWVVPDFARGGGGHMTIFRMVSFFERMGHTQTIWINNPGQNRTDENGYDDIQKHFQFFSGDVKILDHRFKKAAGDAIIATDCWTVWPAQSVSNFKRRFYFVQDFEPSFHPMGSRYLAAEETYKQDIDCICASPWLANLMTEKYGRWARPFWLAADTELYQPPQKRPSNKLPRIAFYARQFTARRAVELGMLALEVLAKRGIEFKADFFGAPIEFLAAPFAFEDHGVASPEELATLFQTTDIGVVFSATNYSLVPQEMMACGLPIVELKGESTECIFPAETVSLAEPHPEEIADAIEVLLADKKRCNRQAEAAHAWVESFSWQASAQMVQDALIERLNEFATDVPQSPAKTEKPKVSVVIPTLDAGPIFEHVLEAVTNQETLWPYEILVIDSGSTDTTLETIAKYPDVKLHQIDKSEFNHGSTRNLGAELTRGDYIAFLTHDAMPANPRWLHNLVMSLEKHPKAAGAFGKHLPYPEASQYTKRDLTAHFDNFANEPLLVGKATNKKRYEKKDISWRQFLHFYSDNNSIMRRSVWKKIPYRPVKFGEDQLWADDIIKAGYGKVYAVRAAVYHSHDFNAEESHLRNKTEAAFFKEHFGYILIEDKATLEKTILSVNKQDKAWGEAQGVSETDIEAQLILNKARLTGLWQGGSDG